MLDGLDLDGLDLDGLDLDGLDLDGLDLDGLTGWCPRMASPVGAPNTHGASGYGTSAATVAATAKVRSINVPRGNVAPPPIEVPPTSASTFTPAGSPLT